jgi:hypothetical protein
MRSECHTSPCSPPAAAHEPGKRPPADDWRWQTGGAGCMAGLSTGARTAEGQERIRKANTKHGLRTKENRQVAAMIRGGEGGGEAVGGTVVMNRPESVCGCSATRCANRVDSYPGHHQIRPALGAFIDFLRTSQRAKQLCSATRVKHVFELLR